GCEYYFGYQYTENDIVCEDWRSRDASWDYCRIAIAFFHDNNVPFWEMKNADELIGNPKHSIDRFCLAKSDDTYVVYLPTGGTCDIELSSAKGTFQVRWYNPRVGGSLEIGSIGQIDGGETRTLGQPPSDASEDWVVLVTKL
ncbi:MAG: putative collagen-binding domain-containing protein, partial [Planctomycetota bacterium]